MLRVDLKAARRLWLRQTRDPEERAKRIETLFLTPTNEAGEVLDFHALRHTCGVWSLREFATKWKSLDLVQTQKIAISLIRKTILLRMLATICGGMRKVGAAGLEPATKGL